MGPVAKDPTVDCQECGACCAYAGDITVHLVEDVPGYMTRPAGGDAYGTLRMARDDGDQKCVALRGEVGGSCQCTIYAHRPALCAEFENGSMECRDARRMAGLAA